MSNLTQVLHAVESGDRKAANELLPLVYEELRKLATHKMANEGPGNTLQPTALVHEAWLRLAGDDNPKFEGRVHFFAAAAEAMRRILIDRARRKHAARHGGGLQRVDFQDIELATGVAADENLLALDEALDRLAARDKPKAELVELRYFAGMTIAEAAGVLRISEPTAKRWWTYARAWLYAEMRRNQH